MNNLKISEMAEAESLNDNDLLTIVQSGINKKITKQNAIGDIIQAINNPTYTTTEGTDLSIDDTRVGKMKFEYYGDTKQDTTTGKNLSNFTERSGNGIAFLGSIITINNPTNYLYAGDYWNLKDNTSLSGKTYTIFTETNGTSAGTTEMSLNIAKTNNAYAYQVSFPTGTTSYNNSIKVATVTLGADEVFTNINFYTPSSTTANLTIKMMIVEGSYTASTIGEFEPYTNGASPNPDYPQEVQTVTGENTIDIVSKNQIGPLSDFIANNSSLQVTTTSTLITVTHTTTQAWLGIYKELDNLIPNSTMTLSAKGVTSTTTGYSMTVRNSGGQVVQEVIRQASGSRASFSFTVPSDGKIIIRLYAGYGDVQIGDTATYSELQLEKGTTVTPYEPYQGQSYELNLGANLFNIQKFWKENKIGSANGIRYVLEQNNAIYITGTPTNYSGCYGRGFGETEVFWTAKANHTYRILIKLSNKVSNIETRFYIGTTSHNDWNILGMTSNGIYIKDYTPTSDINFTQFSIIGAAASNTTPITAVMEIAIYDITNVSITNYQPYFEPIELCKIGDYQDYIYNNGGKWYLRKENGKVDLATLSWTTQTYLDDGYKLFFATINDIKYASNSTTLIDNYSEKYIKSIASGMSQTDRRNHLAIDTNAIRVNATDYPTGLFYYPLATPIEEEITEPTLINQLNAIKYGAESYYGQTNIIITSEELQPTLKVQTLGKIGD